MRRVGRVRGRKVSSPDPIIAMSGRINVPLALAMMAVLAHAVAASMTVPVVGGSAAGALRLRGGYYDEGGYGGYVECPACAFSASP